MKVGIHLPQYGRAAGPDAIAAVAQRAEELGFSDVWVSDHITRPATQSYPSPYLYDPLLALTWAAAATTTIGLGTSVLVVPQYSPVWLANALASLDSLSKGRLTVAVGVGWSEVEFAALGASFGDRGARLDEAIDVMRACWADDPVSFSGPFTSFDDLLVLPKPAHRIPIWVGGKSEPGYLRAVGRGDGFHALGLTPDEARTLVARIRRDQPDPEAFTFSLRTGWDPQGMDPELIRRERAEFGDAGVQHIVSAPWRSDATSWVRSMEMLAELIEL